MLRLPVSLQYFTAYSCWAPRSRSGRIPHRVPSRSLRVADTSTSNNTQAKASEIRQGIPSLRAPDDVKLVLAGTYVEVADFHSDKHGGHFPSSLRLSRNTLQLASTFTISTFPAISSSLSLFSYPDGIHFPTSKSIQSPSYLT